MARRQLRGLNRRLDPPSVCAESRRSLPKSHPQTNIAGICTLRQYSTFGSGQLVDHHLWCTGDGRLFTTDGELPLMTVAPEVENAREEPTIRRRPEHTQQVIGALAPEPLWRTARPKDGRSSRHGHCRGRRLGGRNSRQTRCGCDGASRNGDSKLRSDRGHRATCLSLSKVLCQNRTQPCVSQQNLRIRQGASRRGGSAGGRRARLFTASRAMTWRDMDLLGRDGTAYPRGLDVAKSRQCCTCKRFQ